MVLDYPLLLPTPEEDEMCKRCYFAYAKLARKDPDGCLIPKLSYTSMKRLGFKHNKEWMNDEIIEHVMNHSHHLFKLKKWSSNILYLSVFSLEWFMML